ncbi:ribonuclease Z [Shouchella clausii]|uniref:Ribonuclease Z n=1 Tax=Shouchella rhizosphaerae TaxID=866786 RepID=A0ABZ2CZ60_9BACI|nr:ribonuclease Z [Shouchella clausii]KKI84622.1 ribonuclease Z [Shouchella clausii]MDO7283305.1 ribonuclease Z [Shouchella clausii]MDO7303402.1 ribonuclease Z [Shouchella clausii]PAE84763.1 ribonuclease Z [Shouchella clausii]PAF10938.1 ribonuclease Z [Shouchella clausii]
MELHFLGTGAGVPAKKRNVSALAIRFLERNGTVWLFDCGEATQHQFLHSPLSLAAVEAIFITHLHGDHILGLPGLLSSRSFQGAETPLDIYGPKGLEAFVIQALETTKTKLRFPIRFHVLAEGRIRDEEKLSVDALALDHPVESYAFRIKEQDKPGTLDAEALKAMGVPPGPLYAQLKKGETVKLADGRIVNGSAFLDESIRGRTVVIAGDTAPVKAMEAFASGADVLVHEATFASNKKDDAHLYGHSTIADACALAKRAAVGQLILTHVSSRYVRNENEYRDEAAALLPNVIIAEDLFVFELEKAGRKKRD